MKFKETFFVDIGETMTGLQTSETSEFRDKQKFFCQCGYSELYNSKIKRTLVKNIDDLRDGNESVAEVTCPSCKKVYNDLNKVCLLSPNVEELFAVKYYSKTNKNSKREEVLTLYKLKHFVEYNSEDKNLHFREDIDFIRFNTKTKESTIFLTPPNGNDDDLTVSTGSQKEFENKDIKCSSLTLSNASLIGPFFKYFESVNYVGLQDAFLFLNGLDRHVSDLDVVQKEEFINFVYKHYKIIEKKNQKGESQYFQELPSGFEDGEIEVVRLNTGDYLRNMEELCRLFFSILSFPNITTVFITKGFKFLNNLLQSNKICNPCVYRNKQATSPTRIIEISTNFDRIGISVNDTKSKNQDVFTDRDRPNGRKDKYLKISKILYKNIDNPNDMDLLLEIYSMGQFSKQELETLFQKFETKRLYKLFGRLVKSHQNDIDLEFRHMIHILNYRLDDLKSEFLTNYMDTIRMIDLLELETKTIFRVRTANELKEMHDDYTSRYNAVKDKKQAEFYKKAVAEFGHLNVVVDDVEFTVLSTIETLNKEGLTVGHCIYSYLKRVCERQYLAIHVEHTLSNERATGGFNRSGKSLKFEQLKGYQNSRATAEMIGAVIKFCSINKISCSNGSSDLQPNRSYEKKMSDHVSDKEVEKIREERRKEDGKKGKNKKSRDKKKDSKSTKIDSKSDDSSGVEEKKGFFDRIFGQ